MLALGFVLVYLNNDRPRGNSDGPKLRAFKSLQTIKS